MTQNNNNENTVQQSVQEPLKPTFDLTKVFIGNVNKTATQEEFSKFLEENGWEITELNLMKDLNGNGNRGYAFGTLSSIEVVDKILLAPALNFQGRDLDVKRASPRDSDDPLVHTRTERVFVGGLPLGVTEQELKDFFNSKYSSLGNVKDVVIKKDKTSGKCRGFCFIAFENFHVVDKIVLEDRRPIFQNKRLEIRKADPNFPITGAPPMEDGTYSLATGNRVRGGAASGKGFRQFQHSPYRSSMGIGPKFIHNARPEPKVSNPRMNPGYVNRQPPTGYSTGYHPQPAHAAPPMNTPVYVYGTSPMYPPSYMPNPQAYPAAAQYAAPPPHGSIPQMMGNVAQKPFK